eukprot:353320-Chlamydomonas_euryale.AAC.5
MHNYAHARKNLQWHATHIFGVHPIILRRRLLASALQLDAKGARRRGLLLAAVLARRCMGSAAGGTPCPAHDRRGLAGRYACMHACMHAWTQCMDTSCTHACTHPPRMQTVRWTERQITGNTLHASAPCPRPYPTMHVLLREAAVVLSHHEQGIRECNGRIGNDRLHMTVDGSETLDWLPSYEPAICPFPWHCSHSFRNGRWCTLWKADSIPSHQTAVCWGTAGAPDAEADPVRQFDVPPGATVVVTLFYATTFMHIYVHESLRWHVAADRERVPLAR